VKALSNSSSKRKSGFINVEGDEPAFYLFMGCALSARVGIGKGSFKQLPARFA
jgi:hypothetical protein